MTVETTGATVKGMTAGPDAAVSGHTPIDLPLDRGGTTFIEASAGTGKTHALTTLVARLVLEEARPIDRILVVTFTRAATAELRDRIRRVLRVLLAAVRIRLAGDDAAESDIDSQARELLAGWERREGEVDFAVAARRLEAAMHDIDRANVFTIHGFCQRVLADLAFESGFPFGCEVSGDHGAMVAGAVRDFWRRRLYPASMLVMRHAVENGFLPDGLGDWVSKRRAKVGAEIVGGDPPAEPLEASEAAWREVFEEVRAEWERHRSAFREAILEGNWLSRRSYRVPRAMRELGVLEALFTASEPWLPDRNECARYGREQLARACKKGHSPPDNPLFDALDRLAEASSELQSTFDQWLRWTRREALVEVRESVRARIRTDRRLAYDDLLIELDDALGRAGGARLAERIRREFPCALIDEFQDTDPVQARIFQRIYGEVRAGPASGGEPQRDQSAGVAGPGSDGSGAVLRTPSTGQSALDTSGRLDGLESVGSGEADRAGDTTPPTAEVQGLIDSSAMVESDATVGTLDSTPPAPDDPDRTGEAEPGKPDSNDLEPGESAEGNGAGASARGECAPPGLFIVVGDPKQSIYRFRGADVFAYLAARHGAHERLHLDRNWRSVPALVGAVNAVFAGAAPFVTHEIEYRPVAAAGDGDDPSRPTSNPGGKPLELWLLPRLEGGKPIDKKDANPVVAGGDRERDRPPAGARRGWRGHDRGPPAHRRRHRGPGPHPRAGPADRRRAARARGTQHRDRRRQRVPHPRSGAARAAAVVRGRSGARDEGQRGALR